jgi:hypothetical protein
VLKGLLATMAQIARLQAHKGYRAQQGLKDLREARVRLGHKDHRVQLGVMVQTVLTAL